MSCPSGGYRGKRVGCQGAVGMIWPILLCERTHGAYKPTIIILSILSKGALSVLPSDWLLPYYEILGIRRIGESSTQENWPVQSVHSLILLFCIHHNCPFFALVGNLTFLSEVEWFAVTSPKNCPNNVIRIYSAKSYRQSVLNYHSQSHCMYPFVYLQFFVKCKSCILSSGCCSMKESSEGSCSRKLCRRVEGNEKKYQETWYMFWTLCK